MCLSEGRGMGAGGVVEEVLLAASCAIYKKDKAVIRHDCNPFKITHTLQNRYNIHLWLYYNNVNSLYFISILIFLDMAALLMAILDIFSITFKTETFLMPNKTYVE